MPINPPPIRDIVRWALRSRIGRTQGNDVLTPFDPAAAGQFQHLHLVEPRNGLEVEAVQALWCRELCSLDPAFHHAPFTVDQFQLDQARQELDMIQHLSGALACHLLILVQDSGQLELFEVVGQHDIGGIVHDAPSDKRAM